MNNFAIISTLSLLLTSVLKFLELKLKKEKISLLSTLSLISSSFIFIEFLIQRWIKGNYFPISNLFESLVFLCSMLLILLLLIETQSKNKLVSILVTPIVLTLNFFANFVLPAPLQEISPLVPSLQSDWLMFHVSTMILSYAALIIGSLLSILYLVLHFLNKKEKLQLGYSKNILLENIDNFSYRIIGLAFPFLTLGIIAGAIWANEAWGTYWSWDPKETWALITWLIFAIYLHARIIKKWKKEKAAIISSVGFFIIWLCYLGVNFLSKGLHSYGFLS